MRFFIELFRQLNQIIWRRDRPKYALMLALMISGSLLEAVSVGAVPAFVTLLSDPARLQHLPVIGAWFVGMAPQVTLASVAWGSLGLLSVMLLKNVYLTGVFYYQAWLVENQGVSLADRMFKTYLYAPYEVHLQRSSAELLRNINLDTQQVINMVLLPLMNVIMGTFMTLCIGLVLLVTAPAASVLSLAVVGLGGLALIHFFQKHLARLGRIATAERKESVKSINQGLGAIVDAKIYGCEPYMAAAYKKRLSIMAGALRFRQLLGQITPYFMELIAVFGLLAILLMFVMAGTQLSSILPLLALIAVATVRLRQTASIVAAGVNQIQFGQASMPHLIKDLREFEKVRRDHLGRQQAGAIQDFQRLEIAAVTYQYPKAETPSVRGISLSLERGEAIALIGSTGCGKSTLVNLILGLLEPTTGEIRVNGRNIHIDLRGWQSQVAYIPQFIYLLDDSVRANVAFGQDRATIDDEQVWAALRSARLDDFVRELPRGLDEPVGERGVRLSGGQRQRLGIARALYRKPRVLIMDEATSALDGKTEEEVMAEVQRLGDRPTMIMIAHRLTSIRWCDRAYTLERGEIKGVGPVDAVIHQN